MADDNIIYAQVLLLDNKIESWKICQDRKRHTYDFNAYWKRDRIEDYTMETYVFRNDEVILEDGWNFNLYVYEVAAPKWINKWDYAEDYKGSKATIKTLDDYKNEITELEKAFGGQLQFIRHLGTN